MTQRNSSRLAVALLGARPAHLSFGPAVAPATASAGPSATSSPNLMALLAVQQGQLTATDGAANDLFGWWVAVSGDTALVGAQWDTVGTNASQGSAYVFVRSGTTWSQQAELTAADGGRQRQLRLLGRPLR